MCREQRRRPHARTLERSHALKLTYLQQPCSRLLATALPPNESYSGWPGLAKLAGQGLESAQANLNHLL